MDGHEEYGRGKRRRWLYHWVKAEAAHNRGQYKRKNRLEERIDLAFRHASGHMLLK